MRLVFLIAVFLNSQFAFGQESRAKAYGSALELISKDSITITDLIGDHFLSDSILPYTYSLLPDKLFRRNGYIDSPIVIKPDSGYWELTGNMLRLISQTKKLEFNIFKIGKYYFYIKPKDKEYFLDDLKKSFYRYKGAQEIEVEKIYNGTIQLVSWDLGKKWDREKLTTYE